MKNIVILAILAFFTVSCSHTGNKSAKPCCAKKCKLAKKADCKKKKNCKVKKKCASCGKADCKDKKCALKKKK